MQQIIDHLKEVLKDHGNLTRAEALSFLGIVEELRQERDRYYKALSRLKRHAVARAALEGRC